MRLRHCLLFIFSLVIFLFFGSFSKAHATSITVTANVGDTSFELKGYTSPKAVVTFLEQGAVIGTTVSDNSGLFFKDFLAQTPGPHEVLMYATDGKNRTTISSALSFVLSQNQDLLIDDIYLSPSILLNSSSLSQGDQLIVEGFTKPNAMVKIERAGSNGNLVTVLSNAEGFYSSHFDTGNLPLGSYSVFSTLQVSTSKTSTKSEILGFKIKSNTAPTATSVPTPSPTSSPLETIVGFLQNSNSDCEYEFKKLCLIDNIKKGYIDTQEELSDYLVGFISSFTFDSNLKDGSQNTESQYDINNDGHVDSTDLSIVLFYTKAQDTQVLGISTKDNKGVVLGTSYETLSFSIHPQSQGLLDNLVPLLLLEVVIGIPFFILFIILIVISKRYVRTTTT